MQTEFSLAHYGTPHEGSTPHSGRYPYGSGEDPYQRNKNFLAQVYELRKAGMSDTDIARGMGMTTTVYRSRISLANNEIRKADVARAIALKDKGYSYTAIGREMGMNESSVRSLLNSTLQERANATRNAADVIKAKIDNGYFVDVGAGVEYQLGVSQTKLKTAINLLEEEGYSVHYLKVEQAGTGQFTTMKILAGPDVTDYDIRQNREKVTQILDAYSEDGGKTFEGIEPPVSIDISRVAVRYADEVGPDGHKGVERDGNIQLRRGVDDISLGDANYAQVRIKVGDSHYIKGVATYADDLPDGVDILFNTNKPAGTPMLGESSDNSVFKPLKDDPDNPFQSTVRQKHYIDANGEKKLSALNIVYEEGEWSTWSKTISSQVGSKQRPEVIKEQLALTYNSAEDEFNDILSLTNPVLRKKLLNEFADECDASAVDLKAAGFPRQASHVIIPIPSLKDNECYAPNYKDGETLVLIRYPHAHLSEIATVTNNTHNKEALSVMPNAIDGIGINSHVASRMSGADFDGDTVLVIPNNDGRIATKPLMKTMQNFDPAMYKNPPDAPKTGPKTGFDKQFQMGSVSNLITDMTIMGASDDEIARAMKHSMVVIDAEKHNYDWRKSEQDNQIPLLKTKYQGGPKAGASTLISKSTSAKYIPERKLKSVLEMTEDEKKRYFNGEKIYKNTGKTYYKPIKDKETNEIIGYKETPRQMKIAKLAYEDDARKLISPFNTKIERVYAEHSNKLKELGRKARKAALEVPNVRYSPSAKKAYAKEVASLEAKLNVALKHAPYERQAQLLTSIIISAKRHDNPDMDADDIKKLKGRTLTEARRRYGGGKVAIDITEKEWEAMQNGAFSQNKQAQILDNANPAQVKQLATPRTKTGLSSAKMAQARSMLNRGYTNAEVAELIGVSVSTLQREVLNKQ